MSIDRTWRRLLPLALSRFCQGFILWYAIDKVFMSSIGFDASTIALATIVGSITRLLLEIPSGVLADRWSRKGILGIGYLCLALATFLLGSSDSVAQYLVSGVLFGAYFALNSGIVDSIVYDTVLEDTGRRDNFEKYMGRIVLIRSIGLAASSLLGGLVGHLYGLREAYFLSIPGALIAIGCLYFFQEPSLHKKAVASHIFHQMADTIRFVLRRGIFMITLIALLAFGIIDSFMNDVDQLWPLALDLPVIWYGPLNALLLMGYGLGAPLAVNFIHNRQHTVIACMIILALTWLLTIPNMPAIAMAQFGLLVLMSAMQILVSGQLHDSLPSDLRSGSSSAVSTLTLLLYLPLVFIFGVMTENTSVFVAAYMLLPVSAIGVWAVFELLPPISKRTEAT
ncbi:MAG TPA: MFS transporter [Candidatus Limnocylindrales bacterium]|nr:MFS transporter [Candidatus Limnocylindrales bacterium]